MAGKQKKFNIFQSRKKKFFRTPLFFLVFFMVFYLTYYAYKFFGVGDFRDWAMDVLILFSVFLFVILLAVGVAWIVVKVRQNFE